MMRNLGGAVGIALCSAILNNRTNLHFLWLASNLTASHAPVARLLQDMTYRLTPVLGSPAVAHRAALKELWGLAYAQAATLSYADAFRTIMLAFMLGVCLVPLMRKVVPPTSPGQDSH